MDTFIAEVVAVTLATFVVCFTIIASARWIVRQVAQQIFIRTNALGKGINEVLKMKAVSPQLAQQLFQLAMQSAEKGSVAKKPPNLEKTTDWRSTLAAAVNDDGKKWDEHVHDSNLSGQRVELLDHGCGDMLRERDKKQEKTVAKKAE